MFRITGTESEGHYASRRTPILIVPGLYDDAATWLQAQSDLREEGRWEGALPMFLQLAEAGYDVWVGNNRGTDFGEHRKLHATDPEFWNYTWESMG